MPFERSPEKLFIGHEGARLAQGCLDKTTLGTILTTANWKRLDFLVLPIETIDRSCQEFVERQISQSPSESDSSVGAIVAASTRQWVDAQARHGPYFLTPLVDSDLVLPSASWSNSIVLSLSPWIQIDDLNGKSDLVDRVHDAQAYCQDAFQQQLNWASHCSASATLLPTPTVSNDAIRCGRYAGVLSRVLNGYLSTHLWVRIPLVIKIGSNFMDGWRVWNKLRESIGPSNQLGVALILDDAIPNNLDLLERWIAEPVRAVIIPSHLFVVTVAKLVALPKAKKKFLMKLIRQKVQIIIQHGTLSEHLSIGESAFSENPSSPSLSSLIESIERIFLEIPPFSEAGLFEFPYLDYLQHPLQPLRDNLESQTYETFEKDPVKYAQYEEAIYKCLLDRIAAGKKRHVVMVVGAGRGPLVASSLQALRRANIDRANYHMVAVEKNMNAVITLRSRVHGDSDPAWRHVEIVWSDMRDYRANEKVDIMISELLGSFGDNELSPECLDGAQAVLANDGVMIPMSYWSSLEPISTPKLWSECKSRRDCDKALETSYVVQFHSVYRLSKEGPQKCFEFKHPSPVDILLDNKHNHRYQELTFTAKADSLCHGFAGYFHCDLYKDVHISTDPRTYSEGMFSWFPLYFPLKQAIYVPQDQVLKCHIWRLSNLTQIWYEWHISEPIATTLHNINGRSHSILK